MRQRLLAIGGPAAAKCLSHRNGVHVVGSADHHAVQVVAVEHPPIVVAEFGAGELFGGTCEPLLVDIAQDDDVLARHAVPN